MNTKTLWDFRGSEELLMSKIYQDRGYVIEDAELNYLVRLKDDIEAAFAEFTDAYHKNCMSLENAHKTISNNESNDLRLYVMQRITQGTSFNRNYYNAARRIIHSLCGNELAMQKRPGLSVNLPNNESDVLPIHADTWNGVSPFELNVWVPFVDCSKSMCLYILERQEYNKKLRECKGLLKLTSDELFNELRSDLTWIPIEYGKVLAFDQSLPHGYSLNLEEKTHWSMNCRFKGLHTPYWDKKLGEYFMPITVKSSTRLGMSYEHPENWVA